MCSALSTARNAGHKAHFRDGWSKEGDLIGISCHDGAKATFEKSSSTGKKNGYGYVVAYPALSLMVLVLRAAGI